MNSNLYALQRYFTAELAIEEAAKYGYTHWYLDASLPTDLPETWTAGRIATILDRIRALECRPIVHGNFRLPIASESTRVRNAAVEEVMQELDLAAKFGAPLIIHGGAIVEPRVVRSAITEALGRLNSSLRCICSEAKKSGAEVWLENLSAHRTHPFYYLATSADDFYHILDKVDDIMVFFDIGHANVNSGGILRFLELVRPRLAGISLSDNNGTRDSHGPLGTGTAPITELLSYLAATSWQGIVGIEVRGTNPSDDLSRAQGLMNMPLRR